MSLSISIAELSPGELATWLEQQPPGEVARLLACGAEVLARRAANAGLVRERWTTVEAAEKLPAPRPSRRTTLRWANEGKVRDWDGTRGSSDAWIDAARDAGGRGRKGAR